MARKAENLILEQAAAVPVAGFSCAAGPDRAQIEPGQKVLINGAADGVSTLAVQIAKTLVVVAGTQGRWLGPLARFISALFFVSICQPKTRSIYRERQHPRTWKFCASSSRPAKCYRPPIGATVE